MSTNNDFLPLDRNSRANLKPEMFPMRRLLAPALALGVLVGCSEATGPASEMCSPLVSGYQLVAGDTMSLEQDPRVKYIEIEVGTGPEVVQNTAVDVEYILYTRMDTCFRQASGFPFNAGTGDLVQGFKVGVLGMKEGGTRRLLLSPEVAYAAGTDHPFSGLDLIFDVKVVSAR
jgi:peptidylprolyl isomerase